AVLTGVWNQRQIYDLGYFPVAISVWVLGAAGRLLVQLPALRATGMRWRPNLDLASAGVREVARLMGLPDSYKMPDTYNNAYRVAGDGVAVPVVRYLDEVLFAPLLERQSLGAVA
ncbi:DNA cytosine methyltransferase, partial [uncultured Sulfitobacter sp.]|uniref:DNA cytosine methyltransferase n=1 Tax=uncultured Sulfitobacter sp. TaxID=191468 RepID=UPI0025984708